MTLSGSSVSERELKDWITQSVEHVFREKVDEIVAQRLVAFVQENEQRVRELSLMERVVRVEEELRGLKEIQIAHFNASEKRFEAMDKRFEALQREMAARFEASEKRFDTIDKRFEALQHQIATRFEAMDKRFEAQQRETTTRFEAMDKRFEALQREMAARFEVVDKRFSQLQWMIGLGVAFIVALIGMVRIFG
ncbi:MAG: hypothetical protein WHS46_03045 [Desulfosoma sp.]